MIFTLVFRSICSLRWLRRHKSILLAEILNFQGTSPTLGVGSFSYYIIYVSGESVLCTPAERSVGTFTMALQAAGRPWIFNPQKLNVLSPLFLIHLNFILIQ